MYSGSAHLFVRSGVSRTHQIKLLAPDGAAGDQFGNSVAIYEGTIVVGAVWDDDNGSAHKTGDEWTYRAKMLARDAAAYDFFGGALQSTGIPLLLALPMMMKME